MTLPRGRLFWGVALGHLTNDIFMSMGPVVLAFLKLSVLPGMSNAEIGFAVGMQQLMGAVSQPFFGLASDRYGGRRLGSLGVAWSATFVLLAVLLAQSGQYWLMFVPYVLAALGSGAFHPVGTSYASERAAGREASHTAYFFLMGQLGLALGPALAGLLLDFANPAGGPQNTVTPLFLLGLLVLPAVWLMFSSIPRKVRTLAAGGAAGSGAFQRFLGALPVKALAVLGLMVALRSLAQPGSVTFIPVLFQDKGWDPSEFGLITSSFWIASGIAGVVFGSLADRFDRRYVIAVGLVLAAPAFFFLPTADAHPLAFALAMAAGALSGGSHSVIVILAQGLIPSAKGFASGAILGFIFGMGALGNLIIGAIADTIGLATSFQLVAIMIVVAGFTALLIPAAKPRLVATDREAETAPTPAK